MNSLSQQLTPTRAARSARPESNKGDDCKDSLSEVIENQIIPRLLLAHPLKIAVSVALTAAEIPASTITTFVLNSFAAEPQACNDVIADLLAKGATTAQIFLQLIGPAARQLGYMWDQDTADFTQVTLGLVRMHDITHQLGFEYQDGPQLKGDIKRIMLASAPGSQHFLGMTMVSSFFRKEGWDVVIEISASQSELAHAVGNEWFDVIGVSCATISQLEMLPDLISYLKQSSNNPTPGILLGGPVFTLHPYDAADFGADGICLDLNEAVAMAASFRA